MEVEVEVEVEAEVQVEVGRVDMCCRRFSNLREVGMLVGGLRITTAGCRLAGKKSVIYTGLWSAPVLTT